MKIVYLLFVGSMILVIACETSLGKRKKSDQKETETFMIREPFDTAQVLSDLEIIENAARFDLIDEELKHLSSQIDTIDLTYFFGFCDCQRWIRSDIYNNALNNGMRPDKNDSRGQVAFNIDKHGYYIEAASDDLTINWRAEVNGTRIRLIGREYTVKRLPENGGFTVPDPPKGKVFRYYSYEILRPYKVWGPHKIIETNPTTRDSTTEPTVLHVK